MCNLVRLFSMLCEHWKTSFEKNVFSVLASKPEYGFDQKRLIWYVFHLWDLMCC